MHALWSSDLVSPIRVSITPTATLSLLNLDAALLAFKRVRGTSEINLYSTGCLDQKETLTIHFIVLFIT